MKKQKIETDNKLLNTIRDLSGASNAGMVLDEDIAEIEDLMYKTVLETFYSAIQDEDNKKSLNEEYGITDEEIVRIKNNNNIKKLATLNAFKKKINRKAYGDFKLKLVKELNPNISNVIKSVEQIVLLDKCEKEINKFKGKSVSDEEFAENILNNNINVGFSDSDGNFKNLEDSRLDYFSKYSDEQLDEIYSKDENTRDIINEIRRSRGIS